MTFTSLSAQSNDAENNPSATISDGIENTPISEQALKDMLLKLLQPEEASPAAAENSNSDFLYGQEKMSEWVQTNTNTLAFKAKELMQLLPTLWGETQKAFLLTTDPEDGFLFRNVIITILMHIGLGLIMEYIATYNLLKRLYRYAKARVTSECGTIVRFRLLLIRICIQLLGLAVLVACTYICALFYIRDNQYFEYLFTTTLSSFVFFRLSMLVVRNIFSPYRSFFRLFNLDDKSSRLLFLWGTLFLAVFFGTDVILRYLWQTDMPNILVKGLIIPFSFTLQLILISGIWLFHRRITALFTNGRGTQAIAEDMLAETLQAQHSKSGTLASIWPFLVSAWILSIWLLWVYNTLLDKNIAASNVAIAWWITMTFPIADRLFDAAIANVHYISWLQSPTFEQRANRFTRILQAGFRLLLLAAAIFTVSNAWGFNADSMMNDSLSSTLLAKLINLLIICTLVYIVWEISHALIERKLPPVETDALASLEGDGGGAGATRTETLLPLMRTTLSVFLFVFFMLSSLSSLGIAIGPLLAGAGVIGIAIGFGAQKLVQDILSGIFFLLDDAFRKGEYIEIEDLRGTVENISLRSMQLRHHLGAVQTIPYSEVKTVRNFSRDWVTMKLEIRLPYHTDIEKVRKIIKKVGEEMLKDDIIGDHFLLPLKSQGVMRVEESALIVRMKFTCKPGEQWVIRREAFSRVKLALTDAGIHFAHREVRVLLPEGMVPPPHAQTGNLADNQVNNPAKDALSTAQKAADEESSRQGILDSDYNDVLQKATAAAATGVLAAEAARQSKLDEDFNMGDER